MKALFVLVLFTMNSFASVQDGSNPKDTKKWLKLGYEVARAHAPDYDIVGHIIAEKCEDVEAWTPYSALGESWDYIPSKAYEITKFYEGNSLKTIYWRCVDKISKG